MLFLWIAAWTLILVCLYVTLVSDEEAYKLHPVSFIIYLTMATVAFSMPCWVLELIMIWSYHACFGT